MLLQKELGVIENSYYEATVQRRPSVPTLADSVEADVYVVGCGYAGLSAALELCERGYSVVLLEAQRLGWGASGRNGGQVIAGFGAEGEAAIEKQLSKEDAKRTWDMSLEGLDLIQERISKYNIDCEYYSGHLNLAAKDSKLKELEHQTKHLKSVYHYKLEWIGPESIQDWIASDRFRGGTYDARSGHLHPLKYCLGLADAARHAGVRIYENSAAYIIEYGETPVVKTAQGCVQCKFVILAGNVYLAEYGDIAPALSNRIMPVGTYIIATESMTQARADNRLLFGTGDSYSARTP